MYNSNIPSDVELPSTRKLIKSTVLAIIGAGVLLVTVVMPAEYGIDLTGFGHVTGLTEMGEIKTSLAEEVAHENTAEQTTTSRARIETVPSIPSAETANADPVSSPAPQLREDTMALTLAPNEGAEIKVTLKKGQKVNYEWSSTGHVNFDNHGDSKDLNIDYHGYGKGVAKPSDKGVIEAAFDGNHGWFWRNRTNEPVTITLAITGEYSSIKRVD